jgi:hypothetical protein
MLRFEGAVDLFIQFFVCSGGFCRVQVAAADDLDAFALEVEGRTGILEGPEG